MTAEPLPEWFRTPPGGWTADDLDALPPEAPRMELIDGALIVVSPQSAFHSQVMRRLADAIELCAPDEVEVDMRITVRLGMHQRPEPDIVAVRPSAVDDPQARTFYLPEEVLLVVEIVSPESKDRDRETKPMKYARAGIPHFWRVEKEPTGPAVHVFELETTGAYVGTGIHRDRLKVDVPFPMDIDVRTLNR
ncbi:hypothetical protein BTM25_42440 [Actinomadura rubteroloni]|uniref:Putative restriction endonuclease domain-containing protein n=1 Tax=Actinomadura rubteroloni TaxID=1926885 RepID=A0A2P4UKP2_9ACTN|nr:Uma2 family endonuclease [Actinomadura rubteroloni]POM25596.1 hypothetical protein BTM25_42440 [Actinomadura rubteroloni]